MKFDLYLSPMQSWWPALFPLLLPLPGMADPSTNIKQLEKIAVEKNTEWQSKRLEAETFAKSKGLAIRKEINKGVFMELQRIEQNFPIYYITDNINAAKTTRANKLWPVGDFNLTGSGYSKLGEWDGGKVLTTHQEFGGRVTQADGAATLSDHATHVAGTLVAAGIVANAKGMAYQGLLKSYDWNNDASEMASAAAKGLEISNHSYGYLCGWYYSGAAWYWYGNTVLSSAQDYKFGFYDSQAQQWDNIAYNAPSYLIVKAAGNDRNDVGPAAGASHWVISGGKWVSSKATREADGGADGYDSLNGSATAKNVLTVGAVDDVLNYTGASSVVMTSFSAWGPTDDGRIKPDVVANGKGLYSATKTSKTAYATYSGTSMASPNTAGTLVLLQQHAQTFGAPLRSSMLKSLLIHTANEAGPNSGPDYKFGWGLVNAERAAQVIKKAALQDSKTYLTEVSLTQGVVFDLPITVPAGTSELRATIAWTDPAGTPTSAMLNPTKLMLVNDLDLRIIRNSDGKIFYPWRLSPSSPNSAATTGDNTRDNVEQVLVKTPVTGQYKIQVTHKKTLTGVKQDVSLVVTL